jgi:hypothetical protein
MWDTVSGGMKMLTTFWSAVRKVQPDAAGERMRAGMAEGDIAERMRRAGLEDVVDGSLPAYADYTGFDDFWEPFTFEVGPAGQHLTSMPPEQQARVRELCRAELPADGPFRLEARAWFARGRVPGA